MAPSAHFVIRIAAGYVVVGLIVVLVVTGAIAATTSAASRSLPLTFVLGLGAYLVGGVLEDPLSTGLTIANTILALLLLGRSRDIARAAEAYPWIAAALALAIGSAGLGRLFARSTSRRKPLRIGKPLPGRFSLERIRQYEGRSRLGHRGKGGAWRPGYLGSAPRAWVRAAFHETFGALGWKDVLGTIGRLWGLALIVLLNAWLDKGDLPFGRAVARTLFDAVIRSPYETRLGQKEGAYLMVLMVIAAVGVVVALFRSVALGDGLFYPLSRRDRARVDYRGGLVDVALLALVLGIGLYVVGQLAGLLVGYAVRFDFVPFNIRAVMVTLVLLPLAHWGRLRLQAAVRRKAENTFVGVAFGIAGFMAAVAVCVFLLPVVFVSGAAEMTTLVVAFVLSQLIYRRRLTDYYRTADLA